MFSNVIELYRCRTLIVSLVLKEVKLRYQGSVLGFFWTFLNPLLLMCVYTIVFSVFFRIRVKSYPVFLFCGLLPWICFSTSILEGANSIIKGGNLITRTLFPPQVLPTVTLFSNLVNFVLSLPLLFIFLLLFKVKIGIALIALPIVMIIQAVFTMGLVLIVSALNVHFRDIRHILGNLITMWFFVTPILYPTTSIPAKFRFISYVNPMAILIKAHRGILFYKEFPNWLSLGITLCFAFLVFFLGNLIFNRYKESFSEEV
ncbi:MAG: ABC transporter permease [Candidatus Lokiarchaeia archaeon]